MPPKYPTLILAFDWVSFDLVFGLLHNPDSPSAKSSRPAGMSSKQCAYGYKISLSHYRTLQLYSKFMPRACWASECILQAPSSFPLSFTHSNSASLVWACHKAILSISDTNSWHTLSHWAPPSPLRNATPPNFDARHGRYNSTCLTPYFSFWFMRPWLHSYLSEQPTTCLVPIGQKLSHSWCILTSAATFSGSPSPLTLDPKQLSYSEQQELPCLFNPASPCLAQIPLIAPTTARSQIPTPGSAGE